jgi:hypothetical protein
MQTNDDAWADLFDRIRQSPWQMGLVFSGGGVGALSRCFRRSGASANMVEAVIPYSHAAMLEYVGEPLKGPSASAAVAEQLAMIALARAAALTDHEQGMPVGVALVAALPTSPPRHGDNRVHVAIRANDFSIQLANHFAADLTREVAEAAVDDLVFDALSLLLERG